MKPIIGINLDIDEGTPSRASVYCNYFQSVQKSGGIPILVPPMPNDDLEALLEHIDGVLLIGGRDYSPELYGEELSEKVELINCTRQEFDHRLVKQVLSRPKLPVLGICGGLQLLNIGLGGSLIQDIPSALPQSEVKHSNSNGSSTAYQRHQVKFDSNSLLGHIYQLETFEVNSFHHQAIKKIGSGLKVSARAEDGIIEAVEAPDRAFTVAVQWHPERDFEGNKALFEQFLKASSNAGR
jgi:putative glutamine amidotransferase